MIWVHRHLLMPLPPPPWQRVVQMSADKCWTEKLQLLHRTLGNMILSLSGAPDRVERQIKHTDRVCVFGCVCVSLIDNCIVCPWSPDKRKLWPALCEGSVLIFVAVDSHHVKQMFLCVFWEGSVEGVCVGGGGWRRRWGERGEGGAGVRRPVQRQWVWECTCELEVWLLNGVFAEVKRELTCYSLSNYTDGDVAAPCWRK